MQGPRSFRQLSERPSSAADAVLRLDGMVRLLVALAVDALRRDPAQSARLHDDIARLALPWTPFCVDMLEAYADDLAENVRPSEGLPLALLQSLLLSNFTSAAARQLAEAGQAEGFTTSSSALSFVRTIGALYPLLSGTRRAPAGVDPARLASGVFDEIGRVLRPLDGLALAEARTVRMVDGRARMTLVPAGGSFSEATSASVSWQPPPVEGEVVLIGVPLSTPARCAPLLACGGDSTFILTASPRSPSPAYRLLRQGDDEPATPAVDEAAVAATLFPSPVTADRMATWRKAALAKLSERHEALGASMVGSLVEGEVGEGTVLADRFELLRQVSRGAMGAVFEAREITTGEPAIVKIHVPRRQSKADERQLASDSFAREIEVLETVRHAALPRLLWNGSSHKPPFLALESFAVTTLRDLLTPPAPLPRERWEPIMAQLAAAVEALHDAGVVHRDVKPENVLVRDDDHILLIDFGLARLRASQGVIVEDIGGTVPYMAPEALEGGRIAPATDVFALGCILYECLTGHPLFPGATKADMAERIRRGRPAPADAIGDGRRAPLYDVVRRATHMDPSRRLQDGGQFASALANAVATAPDDPGRGRGGLLSRLWGRKG